MSDTNVQRSSIGYLAGTQFKNLIINPHMEIAQRTLGTPITNLAPYTLDRWATACGAGGTVTATKEVMPLADNKIANYFARLTQSVGHTSEAAFSQPIESVKTAAGQTVTLSFWAKRGANALTIRPDIAQNFGTGGSPSAEVVKTGTPIVLTTTWTKYVQTFQLDAVTAKTLGSNGNDYLAVRFFRTTNNATYVFDITDVQLEVGPSATEIERRPINIEQDLCRRYYEVGVAGLDGWSGVGGVVTSAVVNFRTLKRVTPTLVISAVNTAGSVGISPTSISADLSGLATGRITTGVGTISWTNSYAADAEL